MRGNNDPFDSSLILLIKGRAGSHCDDAIRSSGLITPRSATFNTCV